MNEPPFPVVIVGAGPTGLILAHLLGVAGIKVLLIDRGEATVGEARAVTIDDESLRTLQATGMLAQVLPNITQGYGVEYYSWRNRPFARIDPTVREHGYQKRNAFRQDILVKQLCDGLQNHPHVDVRFQHELLSFAQDATGVTLQVATPHGTEAIRCDWLVACDGGRSSVREKLQIALEGNTFGERWLIADLLQRTSPFRHTRTYCDPVRPAIRLPGPQGAVRYEFMLHAHESPEEALNETQLRAWIRQREPADADLPLARKVVYTFHARVAQRWREGRIFLAGDAAHLTPPFAGQGMNSGVRDASNLAWKLAAVIQGTLPERILDTYEQERKPHAWALIRMALQIGKFMQPKSWWGAAFNQTALRAVCLLPPARDYILQLKFKPKPKFHQGFFLADPSSTTDLPAGQLFPQPMVELPGGALHLLDDVLGTGFAVIQWAGHAPIALPPGMEARHVQLLRRSEDFLPPLSAHASEAAGMPRVRDCEGKLADILDASQAQAVVLRPDRYVFAFVPKNANAQRWFEEPRFRSLWSAGVHPDSIDKN